MNYNTVSIVNSKTVTEFFDKTYEVRSGYLSPPARLDKDSRANLRRAGSGNISFRVIEERNAGGKRTSQFSDIRAARKDDQVTESNDPVAQAIMPLERPEQESLQPVQVSLDAGEYSVRTRRNAEDDQVCQVSQVSEYAGLKKGGAPSPKSAEDFFRLGVGLKPGETVKVGERRKWRKWRKWQLTARDCYRKALKLDPQNAYAYNGLGNTLLATERVRVGKEKMSKRDCYRKALDLEPQNAIVYVNLGATLSATERVQVGKERMSKRDCYRKALNLDPQCAHAYNNLGAALSATERVQVGKEGMTKWDCYRKALDLNPQDAIAYVNLGLSLSPAEHVQVGNETMTQRECYLMALALNPDCGDAYFSLGVTLLSSGGMVRGMSAQDCFRKAITLGIHNLEPVDWRIVANTLRPGEKALIDGRKMTQKDCIRKAEKLDLNNTEFALSGAQAVFFRAVVGLDRCLSVLKATF